MGQSETLELVRECARRMAGGRDAKADGPGSVLRVVKLREKCPCVSNTFMCGGEEQGRLRRA